MRCKEGRLKCRKCRNAVKSVAKCEKVELKCRKCRKAVKQSAGKHG